MLLILAMNMYVDKMSSERRSPTKVWSTRYLYIFSTLVFWSFKSFRYNILIWYFIMGSKTPEEYQQIPDGINLPLQMIYSRIDNWHYNVASHSDLKPADQNPKPSQKGSSSADLDRGVIGDDDDDDDDDVADKGLGVNGSVSSGELKYSDRMIHLSNVHSYKLSW